MALINITEENIKLKQLLAYFIYYFAIVNNVKSFMLVSAILLIPWKWHSWAGTCQMFIKEEETSHNISAT